MTDPRPTLLPPSAGEPVLVTTLPCPDSTRSLGFASAARLDPAWEMTFDEPVAGLRIARHRVDPKVVLCEFPLDAVFQEPATHDPRVDALPREPGAVVLTGGPGSAFLVVLDGGLHEVANDAGNVRIFRAAGVVPEGWSAPIPELTPPPALAQIFDGIELHPAIVARAQALAGEPVGALEGLGLAARTWEPSDAAAAVQALLRGDDVPTPGLRLDAWLRSLDEPAFDAWVRRAHARLDRWAEALHDLDDAEVDPDAVGDELLVERDALESLRDVLARRGEVDLGRRLDALDPLLRDGPPVALADVERPWIDVVRRTDPGAWWFGPVFSADEG